MSDLFVFRCQKCSIDKLIFYARGEYKILHRHFSTGIPFKIQFLIKEVALKKKKKKDQK